MIEKKLQFVIWTLAGILFMGILVAASVAISDTGITIDGNQVATTADITATQFVPGTSFKGISMGSGTIRAAQGTVDPVGINGDATVPAWAYPTFNITGYPSGTYSIGAFAKCYQTCTLTLQNSTNADIATISFPSSAGAGTFNRSSTITLSPTENYHWKAYNTGASGSLYVQGIYLIVE